jgi:hypothetical protein
MPRLQRTYAKAHLRVATFCQRRLADLGTGALPDQPAIDDVDDVVLMIRCMLLMMCMDDE